MAVRWLLPCQPTESNRIVGQAPRLTPRTVDAPQMEMPSGYCCSGMRAATTTVFQRADSVAILAPNAAEAPPNGSIPSARRRAITSGSRRMTANSRCSRSMTAAGVPVGATMPCHEVISKPGEPDSVRSAASSTGSPGEGDHAIDGARAVKRCVDRHCGADDCKGVPVGRCTRGERRADVSRGAGMISNDDG